MLPLRSSSGGFSQQRRRRLVRRRRCGQPLLACMLCCVSATALGTLASTRARPALMRAASSSEGSAGDDAASKAATPPSEQEQERSRPPMLYGTAWKKERTTALVVEAIRAGFEGVDTACQPKHYREDLVGEALLILEERYHVPRSDVWIQTKFTPLGGQGPEVPYDVAAPLEDQVAQSLETSLRHLGRVDSFLLHSPLRTFEDTMTVWHRFEQAVDDGLVSQIGISNCYNFPFFRRLYDAARVKPKVLQNRFYAESNYDADLRTFCLEHGVHYQTFWTVSANHHLLTAKHFRYDGGREMPNPIALAADRLKVPPALVLYAWLIRVGHQPLSGTTTHIHANLKCPDLANDLSSDEVDQIARLFPFRGE